MGGQWGRLASKQVVQCPGQGWAGETVLDAEGWLGPFSCFSNAGSLQTLVIAGQAQPWGRVAFWPQNKAYSACIDETGSGDGRASSVTRPGVRSWALPSTSMSEAPLRGFVGP